jgi:hypothetical protein
MEMNINDLKHFRVQKMISKLGFCDIKYIGKKNENHWYQMCSDRRFDTTVDQVYNMLFLEEEIDDMIREWECEFK